MTGGNENVAGGAIKPEEELKREVERDQERREEEQGPNGRTATTGTAPDIKL